MRRQMWREDSLDLPPLPQMHPRDFLVKYPSLTRQQLAEDILGVSVHSVHGWMAGKTDVPVPIQRLLGQVNQQLQGQSF